MTAPLSAFALAHHAVLGEVEALTVEPRQARHDRLMARGAEVFAERLTEQRKREEALARAGGARSSSESFEEMPEFRTHHQKDADGNLKAERVNPWHYVRAKGHVKRYERMRTCHETESYLVRECGHQGQRFRIGCNQRTCQRCRKARIKGIQRPFNWAREELRAAAKKRRASKVLQERMLTFTTPARGADRAFTTTERIDLVYLAWGGLGRHSFAEKLREHAATQLGGRWEGLADLVHTFRVFEWTAGEFDGLGNPHFHVWHHGPYMEKVEIQELWTTAVKRAAEQMGLNLRADYSAVVDVRAATPKIAAELIKYLVKDLGCSGKKDFAFVAPEVMADVLEALEGRRTRQTSAKFSTWEVAPLDSQRCAECFNSALAAGASIQEAWEFSQFQHFHYAPGRGGGGGPPPRERPGLPEVPREPGVWRRYHLADVSQAYESLRAAGVPV